MSDDDRIQQIKDRLAAAGFHEPLDRFDFKHWLSEEAEVFAHAPEDIAYLLAEVERLREAVRHAQNLAETPQDARYFDGVLRQPDRAPTEDDARRIMEGDEQ